jgi:hypothetical protein
MPHAPRIPYLHLRWRIAIVLFIAAFYHQQHLFLVSRQSLAAKYSSAQCDVDHGGLQPSLNRRDEVIAFQDELIANRDAWTTLGEGWEGKVFAYEGSVIKTLTPGQSSFRNCAPGTEGGKWPTEFAASLRFGGYNHDLDNGRDAFDQSINTTLDGFLTSRLLLRPHRLT